LVDGLVEFPLVNSDEIAVQAWAAMARQDADEALRLWQALRQDFPERPDGFIWPIQIMWQNGRLDEADVMAAAALARFPENPNVLVQHAWIAMARQRWGEALQWWAAVRRHAPEQLEGYLWAARALWQATRLDDADAMAAEALERFPGNPDVQAECAWIAVNRGDWEGALLRWRLVLEAEPERRDAQIGLIQAMRWTGQVDEAEAMAAELLDRHPDDPDLLIEHLWAAVNRGDQPVAAARLAAARDRLQAVGRYEETRRAIESQMPTIAEATNRETAPPRHRTAEAAAAPATADQSTDGGRHQPNALPLIAVYGGTAMKTALAVVFVAAGVIGIEKPDILNLWQEIYPSDPVQQMALDRCGFEDRNFNRLSAEARETCYQKMLPSASALSLRASAILVAPNQVDIARLAGAPPGDIRKQQATERYRNVVRQ
jgi:tetratricopeptide (TPR) repeat protein